MRDGPLDEWDRTQKDEFLGMVLDGSGCLRKTTLAKSFPCV